MRGRLTSAHLSLGCLCFGDCLFPNSPTLHPCVRHLSRPHLEGVGLTLLLRVAPWPGPPGQVSATSFTPSPSLCGTACPQGTLPRAASEGMLPRPELAGHHLERWRGGRAARDQRRPSDSVLLGHAHHGGTGSLVALGRGAFSPSLPGVSVVTDLAGVASRTTLLRSRSLSHLVIPLVPLGQMSGAGALGDTCRDKYGVIQAVTHCVCGIPRPCRRTCRRCLVPWPWPRSNSPTCSLQSCSAGPVAWPSITWAITGGPGTGVCQAGPLLPSSRLWILSCSFLSQDL